MIIEICMTEMINKTNLRWNDHDLYILNSIKKQKRCELKYKDAPCVKKFFKAFKEKI